MALLRFIPIKLTICLVLGILIGKYLEPSITWSAIIAISSLGALGLLYSFANNRTTALFGAAVFISALAIGLLAYSTWLPQNWQSHYSHRQPNTPHTFTVKVVEVLKPTPFALRFVGKVTAMDGDAATGKIALSATKNTAFDTLGVDHEFMAYGTLDTIGKPLNPHQFDYENYMATLGIYHQLRLNNTLYIAARHYKPTLYGTAAKFRNTIISKLKEANFGDDELGIIQALLLGQRNDISQATFDDYKNAGAVHILAVSGLHIGIILMLLQFLLKPLHLLPHGKTVKLVVIVVLLWGFALLAGFSASVVRAVTMFTFVAYALYLNRPGNTFNILALSMFFILLLFDPTLIFQVGFQMSYAAVFAIVWAYPELQRLWRPKNIAVRKIWQLTSVGVAAQLGVLPISLFYFHQFPGLFFISNLVIVPFLGLVLGIGILVSCLALMNTLPHFLATFYNSVIHIMNGVIELVARQEAFVFNNIAFDGLQLVLLYAVIIALFSVMGNPTFKKTVILLTSVLVFQVWTMVADYRATKKEVLLLAHQSKNTVLMHHYGTQLTVSSPSPLNAERIISDYGIAGRILETRYERMQNSYRYHQNNILFIDSLGSYAPNFEAHYVVLTQSPKINLERMIGSMRPRLILADGSNYKSNIDRWRATCEKLSIPFHFTGEKGAYYFDGNTDFQY